jgi:L,D-transpeptidase ErfK/SrfK
MRSRFRTVILLLGAWLASPCSQASDSPAASDPIVGREFAYTVQAGDSLTGIGARFGQSASLLARDNGLRGDARLKPGQLLRVDSRHIVPEPLLNGILINIPQRMLFHFENGVLHAAYAVGLGRADWATPTGSFKVVTLEENKTWMVPKSIQEEMLREGQTVQARVPPGPDNPLGRHWIGLSLPGYGIHGTIAPASIYQFRSHGCIRLHPDDVAELFGAIHIGDPGRIVYTPVLLASQDDGRILLEVHPDVYKKGPEPLAAVRSLADARNILHLLDWAKVAAVIREQAGVPRDVSLSGGGEAKEGE